MRILIGADLVPTKSNMDLFENGNAEELVGAELLQLLTDSESYCIFNLETPLCDKPAPIPKCGPALIAPTNTIAGYKSLGVNLLTLANNHILDQGVYGLESTQKILDQNQINYLGIGKTVEEAAKPYTFEKDGKIIGIYACAEHEFSIVSHETAGANPFDPLDSLDHIAELKHCSDYVVVLYHGGKEHYRYPSPYLQKVCRKMVDKGADLVVCQHSHCIGCEEKYNKGTIVYGQGNFLFDYSNNECWQTGLLIQLDSNFDLSYIPIQKKDSLVRLATGQSAKDILKDFAQRSVNIQTKGYIERNYSDYAITMFDGYISGLQGQDGFIFRVINKLSGHMLEKWDKKRRYQKKEILRIRNYIECEAHRELLLKGLVNSDHD